MQDEPHLLWYEYCYNSFYHLIAVLKSTISHELHLQIEDIQAEERLQHPKGAYYQERSNQNED